MVLGRRRLTQREFVDTLDEDAAGDGAREPRKQVRSSGAIPLTVRPRRRATELHRRRGSAAATRRKDMDKSMNLRAAAGLALLLLTGCATSGGPVRDANAPLTPLHEAALSGNITTIRALLAGGAAVNARAGGGATPLHLAAGRKTFLIALEADAKGGRGELSRAFSRATGLDTLGEADRNAYLKSAADRVGAIQALLAGGANVDARANDGSTPLHQAAALGDVAAIRVLLAGGASVNAKAKDGSTPLHQAARLGEMASIQALLAGGADVDARNKDGVTPLHAAAVSGKAAVIPTLLAGGADVNARAKYGVTPLHFAAMRKMILAALEADAKGGRDKLLSSMFPKGMVDTLSEADREITAAILRLADDDRADTVRALLAGGAAVNARGGGGTTPLHYAAVSGDAAAVEALLDVGGDPNAVAFGCGPMDMARRRMENTETSIAPFRDSIEALRAAGARPQKGCRF